jgi:aminodeoxyfutalosine deaminase
VPGPATTDAGGSGSVLHRAPVVLPVCAEPIRDGAVEVRGGRVSWVGPAADHRGAVDAVRDWPGVLMPGLVNAHTHLQYTDFADLASGGVPFDDWLAALVRRRARFTDAMWRDSARRGVAAALRTGTTCVADVVTDPCALEPLAASGLTGLSYVEAVAADDELWAGGSRRALLDALDRAAALSGAGRLGVGLSPHTPYTLGTAVYRECVRVARDRGLRLHPHLAESAAEVEFVLAGTGPFAEAALRLGWALELLRDGGSGLTPTAYLDRLGALGPATHVAHGVHLDAADRALLRRRGVAVALCPRSNALLMAGEAPVASYRAEGNAVAVGTDSLASAPSLDLFADVAALREIALRQGTRAEGLDRWLVEAATAGGARALGLADGPEAVGVLRPGVRADLAVFDVPTGGDPYAALVAHAAGSCVGTVLAGEVVHERTGAASGAAAAAGGAEPPVPSAPGNP